MLGEIKQDCGRLEDRKALRASGGRSVPIHQDGDSAIRIQGVDVPWFLLPVGPENDVFDADSRDRMVRYRSGKLV